MAMLSRRPELVSAKRAEIEARVLEATEALLEAGASYPELSIERIARAGLPSAARPWRGRGRRRLRGRPGAHLGRGAVRRLASELARALATLRGFQRRLTGTGGAGRVGRLLGHARAGP